jgi:enoyl-CoA hydratase/carnithine racemase
MADLSVELDDGVATVRLERDASRNALSDGFLAELVSTLVELEAGREVGCAVIAGRPGFFSVGADIHELAAREAADVLRGSRAESWRRLRDLRLPLVAAVSGRCLGGGCELALSCDLIVASADATFAQPETALGLIPGGGGTQMLVELVGRGVAAEMILAGRVLDAAEAKDLGLVAAVAGPDHWLEEAQALAGRIAARPALAQLLAKQAIRAAADAPLHAGVALERALYQVALAEPEARRRLSEFGNRGKK